MQPSGTRAIFVSLLVNIGISLAQIVAASVSGSAAMLSAAVHSLADITHELLLLLGVWQARAPVNKRFPYGQGKAVYFWGLIAVIFFAVGGCVAFVNGVQHLLHPEPVEWSFAGLAVLGIALVLNGVALMEAVRQFRRTQPSGAFLHALRVTRDPSMRILIFQNSLDIVGGCLALSGLILWWVTGIQSFDGVAGMIIGVLLIGAALWQAAQLKSMLIGESADEHITQGIRRLVGSCAAIRAVEEISTLHMGPESILVTMRVQFIADAQARHVSQAAYRLEQHIMAQFPLVKRVYVTAAAPETVAQQAAPALAHVSASDD
jgi:cation diffusion facilitator family transporter